MKTLNSYKVIDAEKRLIEHLSLGGDVDDLSGRNLVVRQIQAAWNDEEIRAICNQHRFIMEDLCQIYAACIDAFMPNPCIMCGGMMLTPTLFLLEAWRLRENLNVVARHSVEISPDGRLEDFKQGMIAACQGVQDAHNAAHGVAPFKITPAGGLNIKAVDADVRSGCGCLSVIVFLLASTLFSVGLACILLRI